jgi:electron transfer flavoprotein alpha subunit
VEEQVRAAVHELIRRGALDAGPAPVAVPVDAPVDPPMDAPAGSGRARAPDTASRPIAVLVEPGRPEVTGELLGAAARLGAATGAAVHALSTGEGTPAALGAAGADLVVVLDGSSVPEDVADAVADYVRDQAPWALLAPSTAYGREVAGRAAAATGSGLVGDAIALSARGGVLVAAKPAFAGALVADITCTSATQMATVRPGVLPVAGHEHRAARVETRRTGTRGRVRVLSERRDDDVETLARAEVVIGVGTGVLPEEYEQLSPLAALLGAELGATRKVTDRGWAPRSRQVGITGRSIAPRLYVALGLSGKFNHVVGVRAAGTILAINRDPGAPVFAHCDIGIVGDWHEVVPLLQDALRHRAAEPDAIAVD